MSSDWAILQVTSRKRVAYSESESSDIQQLYFEVCDLDGRKVAGAATIPFPNIPEVANYRTVILSKLEPNQVITILQKAGIKL